MVNYITTFQLYFGMILAGIFTGLGSALGNYLANKHVLGSIRQIKSSLTKKKKKK
jgi:hypothetical protein